MKFDRLSGILLHPTSLPGPYGIGDLGPAAFRWVDFLGRSGCGLWQVLPLGPTGYGDSPYQCFSAFAGNPNLISPELLVEKGLLHPFDLVDRPIFPDDRVDFGLLIPWKGSLLDRAFERYQSRAQKSLRAEIEDFQSEHAHWLEDYALFMALKEAHGGASWTTWESGLRLRDPDALAGTRLALRDQIVRQVFRQYIFFLQWSQLREYAHQHGIQIIGDIPIFVAHDSADVWSHPELFNLKPDGNPVVVAGVPPDYFSPTGQLWGNPIYRWKIHAADGYAWWLERIKAVLAQVDFIRLDHFRGFAGYWEVRAGLPTAEKGRWVRGPGRNFFRTIQSTLGSLPLIAEDLGEITPDVVALREQFQLPGMKILQFAFGAGAQAPFLPHNYSRNCVVYTGTHDNDTSLGWFKTAGEDEREYCRRYLGTKGRGREVVWQMIRSAWASVAIFALAPMQDFLVLDTRGRMNFPGRPGGNWSWRVTGEALTEGLEERILELNETFGRKQSRQAEYTGAGGLHTG